MADPFLPATIKGLTIPEQNVQKQIIRKFIDDLYYEKRKLTNNGLQTLGNMKELWWYLSFSFNDPHKVFSLIKKKKTFNDYEDSVNLIFEKYKWIGQKNFLFGNQNQSNF